MEVVGLSRVVNEAFWRDKQVLVTGHTGFKGSWLSLWLASLGSQVHGLALEPPTETNLFTEAGVRDILASHTIADIRDAESVKAALARTRPEVVLHLAAQPLVRDSYRDPVGTYATNVMGTVHLLEAVRQTDATRAVVNVTTDKCYENLEWVWAYRENEPMGGHDPYSSSKGCSELITAAYRRSFLEASGVGVASARAGNVIGGGDWAPDRLVPDFFRAADANVPVSVRNPTATRPWQHVLEPVSGYLTLAEKTLTSPEVFSQAWNFGPDENDERPVGWIMDALTSMVRGTAWTAEPREDLHEAQALKLDSSKARRLLGWAPRWHLGEALRHTVKWHQEWRSGADAQSVTLSQIDAYCRPVQA